MELGKIWLNWVSLMSCEEVKVDADASGLFFSLVKKKEIWGFEKSSGLKTAVCVVLLLSDWAATICVVKTSGTCPDLELGWLASQLIPATVSSWLDSREISFKSIRLNLRRSSHILLVTLPWVVQGYKQAHHLVGSTREFAPLNWTSDIKSE